MDRAEAFRVLAFELNQLAAMPFEALTAMVGVSTQRFVQIGACEAELEIRVSWKDHERRCVELRGKIHGPSCWRTERMESTVVVSNPR